ncbi:L,D-transpeptidase family protein [Niveispirillum irakense]|uniref:L,D-transpeptidase family protein n=1 Tax=Niveispirillum irakense TaxID=34011 RepID=UPI0003F85C71|nr:L,D-transpeptidase family protein [Niveispirillum irakense]
MDVTLIRQEDGTYALCWPGNRVACAVGRGGVRLDKREGDGATPVGVFPFRRAFYRPDRQVPPFTGLPLDGIERADGWCDDPAHPDYNRPVKLPFTASHEVMWMDEDIYDLVLVPGHNDDPPVPGLGSAVFVHLARPGFPGTAGCIALERPSMLALLAVLQPGDRLVVPADAVGHYDAAGS